MQFPLQEMDGSQHVQRDGGHGVIRLCAAERDRFKQVRPRGRQVAPG